ncbi:MAG TPA: twin-arginine translocase TatA/TatE family subunit [Microthrixaceae bacterium]|nr:twin-arginine translocase TatA/TatE family subunit [Microthrixaceae bacterium]
MFNVTGGEIVIIVLVALVVLGPDRIPDVARNIGRMINKMKTMTEGFQSTVSDITDDPSMKPLKDLGELAARPRQKLAEFAAEAEAEERTRQKLEEKSRREAEQAEAVLATTDDAEADSSDTEDSDLGPPAERPIASDAAAAPDEGDAVSDQHDEPATDAASRGPELDTGSDAEIRGS